MHNLPFIAALTVFLCGQNLLFGQKKVNEFRGKQFLSSFVAAQAGREIPGRLESIRVARQSGHFVVSTIRSSSEGYVYFFDNEGNQLWRLDNAGNSEISDIHATQVNISRNGEGILVNWLGDNNLTHIQFYDNNMHVLFEKVWAHGFYIDALANDGSFLFGNTIYLTDGTTQKIVYPPQLQIPPNPETTLISKDRIAINAVVKADTIFSRTQPSRRPKKRPRNMRRPPRGILRVETDGIFMIVEATGSVVFEQRVNNAATRAIDLVDTILIEDFSSDTKLLILVDYAGNVIWETQHPTGRLGDHYWFFDKELLYLVSDYRKLVLVDRKDGRSLDSLEFKKADRIGDPLDVFRVGHKIYISRIAAPENAPNRFNTRVLRLDRTGKIANYHDSMGLTFKLPGDDNYLTYRIRSEESRQGAATHSKGFRIMINKKPIQQF